MGDSLSVLGGWYQRTETSCELSSYDDIQLHQLDHCERIVSKAHKFGLLLNALLVWALCVQLQKVSDLQLQICRLWSRTVSVSSSRWCSPKSATGTEIWDCWTVLIKLLKMVSNLSVKSAFDGRGMEVGKYNPSLLKTVRVLLCQFDMRYNKEWDWWINTILYCGTADMLEWSEGVHWHVKNRGTVEKTLDEFSDVRILSY